jgi:hypothetical protein
LVDPPRQVALGREGAFTGQAILIGGQTDDVGMAALPMPDGSLMVSGYRSRRPRLANPAFRRTVVTPAR